MSIQPLTQEVPKQQMARSQVYTRESITLCFPRWMLLLAVMDKALS